MRASRVGEVRVGGAAGPLGAALGAIWATREVVWFRGKGEDDDSGVERVKVKEWSWDGMTARKEVVRREKSMG
jgi:hypothetical protein